jgi:hypothetical protein
LRECDDRLFELLPWYVNDSLSLAEKKLVEDHLKVCSRCQKELEEIKLLYSGVKELGEVFASPHVETEKLVLLAEEPESLIPDEITAMVKHIQSCPECFAELQTLKSANLELEALEGKKKRKFTREASWGDKIAERLIWLVRKPALAYIIVLLLAYPAARWLIGPSQPRVTSVPKVVSEKVYLLSEQTRVTAEPTSVFRSNKEKRVRIGIPFWPDLEKQSYELKISTEAGQTIFAVKDFTDFGNQGFFQLILNTDSIPDGRYILILRETNRKDPASFSETNFPFQILKAKD